jgi:hypothetical protein
MLRADVVNYLKEHLKDYPADDLRQQLAAEGITEFEFDTALKEALRPVPEQPTKVRARASGILARVLMFGGTGAILAAAALAVFQKPAASPGGDTAAAVAASTTTVAGAASGESGFVGKSGYVIKLPPGYSAVQNYKDDKKTIEVVHFCKSDTDPTNFLDEGLFGQLGIVRLTVSPSPVSDDLHGLDNLSSLVQNRALQRGEKFTAKNLQISTLRGVQLIFEAPFPRVEAYILGHTVLYSFTAGQDDETYRGLIQSLRDSRSEI